VTLHLLLVLSLRFQFPFLPHRKNEKATRIATKHNLKDVNITETVETNVRAEQYQSEKNDKSVRTDTKNNLKDVVITDTIEGGVRKEQHNREKTWTETGRQQKVANTNFDMARALFN
jgi:hypothetical protein